MSPQLLYLYMTMAARTILLLCLLTSWGIAQTPIPAAHGGTGDEYSYLVSATYMHVHTDSSFGRPLGLNGFAGSFSRAMWPSTRLTGEVGHYTKNGISLTSFLAGPQAGVRIWRIQPYVSILGGLSHINRGSSNDFTVAAGGGLDVPWTNHIRIRALQCDYYRLFGGTYSSADYLRIGFGLAYAFGE
ncbi:MAG TPA: hypothetical protein VJU82_15855 [Acidobacteriaceae bacterium]|nr:hypothetical protein [Acidobacteriaceae bacterium]